MAAKRRPRRITRPAKKRPAKKRVSSAAAKVRGTRKSAVAASSMVEAALAAFAHEVRTPLTGILAISDLLATSDLDERERRWVDTIKAGAEHLASLATLFVDAARSRGPGLGVRQDFFDLRALARSVGDLLAGRATAKGLQSQVEISEKLPAFVIGDPVRLRAALENLIDNAAKFTEPGGVALSVTPMRGPKGKVSIAFAVSDSGIGLTLNEIKRLFRPFSQANVSIASRFGGAGLGLSSVKALARAMGGDIIVEQRPGGGTTFTLSVTLARAKAPKAGNSGADADSPGIRRGACAFSASRTIRSAASCSMRSSPNSATRRNSSAAARSPPSGSRRRFRRGADGHGAAGHQRHRGDQANSQLPRRSAASRSSGCRAAATTRRHRAPPAPTPFWSSLCLRGPWRLRCMKRHPLRQPRLHDGRVQFAAVDEDRCDDRRNTSAMITEASPVYMST